MGVVLSLYLFSVYCCFFRINFGLCFLLLGSYQLVNKSRNHAADKRSNDDKSERKRGQNAPASACLIAADGHRGAAAEDDEHTGAYKFGNHLFDFHPDDYYISRYADSYHHETKSPGVVSVPFRRVISTVCHAGAASSNT